MVKNRIAVLRRMYGMNQRELGDRLGVAQTTISAWETGRNEPDNDSLHRMATLFHTTIGYLTGFEPESRLHGLTPEEYATTQNAQTLQREIDQWEQRNNAEADEEVADYLRQQDEERWHQYGEPDTLEGFLICEMVDALPAPLRQTALTVMEGIMQFRKQAE